MDTKFIRDRITQLRLHKGVSEYSDRKVLIADMTASLPYIDDSDMADLMKETIKNLESMTEEEFAEIVFEPAVDEGEAWEA